MPTIPPGLYMVPITMYNTEKVRSNFRRRECHAKLFKETKSVYYPGKNEFLPINHCPMTMPNILSNGSGIED